MGGGKESKEKNLREKSKMHATKVLRMARGKSKTITIKMTSTAGTGYSYYTTKNPVRNPDKWTMKKYDPVARKHVVYKEGKIK